MIKELVTKCRSFRRFYQEEAIPEETLRELVDTARLTASTVNSQALKFRIVSDPEECERVFPHLTWAIALKNWPGPGEGEHPGAYIVICCDQELGKNKQWDEGIAAQTILLAATEAGYGGCMIGSCRRAAIAEVLGIDTARFPISLVLALGKPKDEVRIVPVGEDGSITYYRDETNVHYVPKRSLEEILL